MLFITANHINYNIFVMVTGALLLASVFHSTLFFYNRQKLIGYYTLYLWSVFGYCLLRCIFFKRLPYVPYFSVDEVLQMLSFALYIRFTKVAMELDPVKDRLAYWYSNIAPAVIAGYVVIHSVTFQMVVLHKLSLPFYFIAYLAIRLFLLFIGFISLVVVIKKRHTIYFRWIFYGILSLIVIGLGATLTEIIWKYNPYVDALTLLALGYNIDTYFFSAAISYKMRMETVEKEKANQRVLEQELLIQRGNMERLVMSFKVKEEERSRIATELHDEIGSTISSISILSDVITREQNPTSITSMQHEIKSNSKLIMEKMDDIIWSLNPRNDSMEKMLLRLKQFATPLFEARNIDYDYEIADNVYQVPIPIEVRQQAYLIIKEAINNVIKHAACTGATFSALYDGDKLTFMISDNGRGYDPDRESDGNGLYNMKGRAKNIGAVITFSSVPGAGTTTTLVIKLG